MLLNFARVEFFVYLVIMYCTGDQTQEYLSDNYGQAIRGVRMIAREYSTAKTVYKGRQYLNLYLAEQKEDSKIIRPPISEIQKKTRLRKGVNVRFISRSEREDINIPRTETGTEIKKEIEIVNITETKSFPYCIRTMEISLLPFNPKKVSVRGNIPEKISVYPPMSIPCGLSFEVFTKFCGFKNVSSGVHGLRRFAVNHSLQFLNSVLHAMNASKSIRSSVSDLAKSGSELFEALNIIFNFIEHKGEHHPTGIKSYFDVIISKFQSERKMMEGDHEIFQSLLLIDFMKNAMKHNPKMTPPFTIPFKIEMYCKKCGNTLLQDSKRSLNYIILDRRVPTISYGLLLHCQSQTEYHIPTSSNICQKKEEFIEGTCQSMSLNWIINTELLPPVLCVVLDPYSGSGQQTPYISLKITLMNNQTYKLVSCLLFNDGHYFTVFYVKGGWFFSYNLTAFEILNPVEFFSINRDVYCLFYEREN